jgi:hypothetical protein
LGKIIQAKSEEEEMHKIMQVNGVDRKDYPQLSRLIDWKEGIQQNYIG